MLRSGLIPSRLADRQSTLESLCRRLTWAVIKSWQGTAGHGHFVGGNAHPQARAANQYAAIDLPHRHQVRNTRGNLRVVDWMAIGNAPVDNFMPQPANHFDQHCPHKVSAVICTDGDTHGNETFLILFPLTDEPNRCVQTSCRAWAAGRYSVSLPDKTGNETAILDPAYAEQVCQGGHLCLKRKQHSPAERAD